MSRRTYRPTRKRTVTSLSTTAIGALLGGLACATTPPVPEIVAWNDPGGAEIVVEDDERTLWEQAQQDLTSLEAKGQLFTNARLTHYLDGVLSSVLPGPLPDTAPAPTVHVFRHSSRDAAVAADGSILVSTSLLAALQNEAQLAALLGHEIAHFLARHAVVTKRYAEISASTVERMKLARAQETFADRFGLELMRKAGYDTRETLRMLELIEREDAAARGPVRQWESHPLIPARVRALRKAAAGHEPAESRLEAERYEEAVADLLVVAAEIELEAGLLDRAEVTIARHLRLRPESGRGYYLKAEYARLTEPEGRRSESARVAYERAVDLAPDDPDALRALGILCREAGEDARAQELFASYLRVAPKAADRKIIERYLESDAEKTW